MADLMEEQIERLMRVVIDGGSGRRLRKRVEWWRWGWWRWGWPQGQISPLLLHNYCFTISTLFFLKLERFTHSFCPQTCSLVDKGTEQILLEYIVQVQILFVLFI
ncbi:hypothetical protein L6452_20268 [Arctium lappa]|uniref:Uncharacterized protein n=1 Tax=Arctium lappa TaxID=4217 RepID=A0ACB9BC62_ARCLA|nr:hypothetical protein L6452_20268 [Arctium lappa]